MTKKMKRLTEMTTEELARQTAEFEEEFVADGFQPLSEEDRARWEKARRKNDSPETEAEGALVSLTVEPELLRRVDALAHKLGTTRDQLLNRGLKAVLVATGEM